MATYNLTREQATRFEQAERLQFEPRCTYQPHDHGIYPVGYYTCPQCGARSYWPASSEEQCK